jgi:hypothetical protein
MVMLPYLIGAIFIRLPFLLTGALSENIMQTLALEQLTSGSFDVLHPKAMVAGS